MSNKFCECPEQGELGCPPKLYDPVTELPFVNHKPGECQCTNELKLYTRKGKKLLLCSICHFMGDKPEPAQ